MTLTAYLAKVDVALARDPDRPRMRATVVQNAYTTIIAIYEPASPDTKHPSSSVPPSALLRQLAIIM